MTVTCFTIPLKERLRVLREYPTTPSLGDNAGIETLLRTAREKGKGSSDDPFRHETLEGGRGGKGEGEKKDSEKAKDSSHDEKRSDVEVKCV